MEGKTTTELKPILSKPTTEPKPLLK